MSPNSDPNNSKNDKNSTQSIGRGMYALAWLVAIALLTVLFSGVEEKRINPNQNPEVRNQNGFTEVVLKQNRQGHYVTSGYINGKEVIFLLDTGATDVSVPEHMADNLNISKGRSIQVSTANGTITAYQSWIAALKIGELNINDVDANINPGMDDDFILLGMSALKKVEFTQRGDTLTLRAYQ